MTLSELFQSMFEQIQSFVYPIGGPVIVGLVFIVLAARARASALSDFKTYDKIWQPVSSSLKESPSASDTLIVGLRALVRGSIRIVLMVVFAFLAFDFFLTRGNLTLAILQWLGL